MSNALTTTQDRSRLIAILESSLYPGAQPASIEMVLEQRTNNRRN